MFVMREHKAHAAVDRLAVALVGKNGVGFAVVRIKFRQTEYIDVPRRR